MTELTDRYVGATLRSIPERNRGDIEAELRASIADAVETRVATGQDVEMAEKEVLTDLGNPDRLAADYAGRPGYLIGPEVFFVYKRLLSVLLVTVVPIVGVALALVQLMSGGDAGLVVGRVIGTTISLVVHIFFWTTLIFALIERSDQRPPEAGWTLESLPPTPSRGTVKLGDTIATVTALVLAIAGLILSRTWSPVTANGEMPVPVFDPAMWDFWLPLLIVVLALEIVFELIKYRTGGWTWGLASVNLALNAAFAIPAIYLLATDQLFNPSAFAEMGWGTPEVGSTGVTLAITAIAAVALWDSIQGFRRARN